VLIDYPITRLPDYPIAVRSRDHDGRAIGIQRVPRGGVDVVDRDGREQRRQARIVVEAEAEHLLGLEKIGDRAVGLERARDRADQIPARLVELLRRQAAADQPDDLFVDGRDRAIDSSG
jgi:hypothetical protein